MHIMKNHRSLNKKLLSSIHFDLLGWRDHNVVLENFFCIKDGENK
jgi:hypothetical protein